MSNRLLLYAGFILVILARTVQSVDLGFPGGSGVAPLAGETFGFEVTTGGNPMGLYQLDSISVFTAGGGTLTVCLYDDFITGTTPIFCQDLSVSGGVQVFPIASPVFDATTGTGAAFIFVRQWTPGVRLLARPDPPQFPYFSHPASVDISTSLPGGFSVMVDFLPAETYFTYHDVIPYPSLGSDCSDTYDICHEDLVVECTDGYVTNTTDCTSWGCKTQAAANDVCYTEFETGALCSLHKCEGLSLVHHCIDGQISGLYSSCNWGCDPTGGVAGGGRCFDEFEMGAVHGFCTTKCQVGPPDALWTCDGIGDLLSSEYCEYGCSDGVDFCLNENDPDSYCSGNLWFCDSTNTVRLQCDGTRIISGEDCGTYGCIPGAGVDATCPAEFDNGAFCSVHKCQPDGSAIRYCVDGKLTDGEPCFYGCDSSGGVLAVAGAGRCYDSFEADAEHSLCNDLCEVGTSVDYLWACADDVLIGIAETCEFGCNAAEKRCFAEYEDGSRCSGANDVCDESDTNLIGCDGSQVTSTTPCSFGCKPGEGMDAVCYDEWESSALCSVHKCDGVSTLRLCVDGRLNLSVNCQYGCDATGGVAGSGRCHDEFELNANHTSCTTMCEVGPPDTLWTCDASGNLLISSEYCEYGCTDGLSTCHNEYDTDSYCSGSLWFCDASLTRRLQCDGSRIIGEEDCSYGCLPGAGVDARCLLNFEEGALCSVHMCLPVPRAIGWCIGGQLTYGLECPYGCDSSGGDLGAARCYDRFEIGAENTLCNDLCELDAVAALLWACADEVLTGVAEVCEFGCNSAGERCYGEMEMGALCSVDKCAGANLLGCDGTVFNRSDACLHGCNAGLGRCFNEFEAGALCSDDKCDPSASILWECSEELLPTQSQCLYGCDDVSLRCRDEFEIGAMCFDSVCEGNTLWNCTGVDDRVFSSSEVCEFGCDRAFGGCFSEYETDASCEMSKCDGDTLWLCKAGAFSDFSVCPFGCDIGGGIVGSDRCFGEFELGRACVADQCDDRSSLWDCDGTTFVDWSLCPFGCVAEPDPHCEGVPGNAAAKDGPLQSAGAITGITFAGIISVIVVVAVAVIVIVLLVACARKKTAATSMIIHTPVVDFEMPSVADHPVKDLVHNLEVGASEELKVDTEVDVQRKDRKTEQGIERTLSLSLRPGSLKKTITDVDIEELVAKHVPDEDDVSAVVVEVVEDD